MAPSRMQTSRKVVDLRLGVLIRDAVSFLDGSQQLLTLAPKHGCVVLRQLSPAHQKIPPITLPTAFNLIPVHVVILRNPNQAQTLKKRICRIVFRQC